MTPPSVHTLRFAANNEFDIPTLDAAQQPDSITIPCRAWGSTSRRRWHNGGWHFYVDDYRFSALFSNPQPLIDLAPLYACEVNVSIGEQSPTAEVIWSTYRKRWLSCYWQMHGVPVFADLNVPPVHLSTNGLGLPEGWRAFSTRGYESQLMWLEEQHAFAKSMCGDPLFLVVGGSAKVSAFCRANRCVHLPYSRRPKHRPGAANPCSYSQAVADGR